MYIAGVWLIEEEEHPWSSIGLLLCLRGHSSRGGLDIVLDFGVWQINFERYRPVVCMYV